MQRSGHCAGARHLEWSRLLTNSAQPERVRRFRPSGEIRGLMEEAGLGGGAPRVAYCQAAVRGAFMAFALELMGLAPKLYDGSMGEWASRDDTPLE